MGQQQQQQQSHDMSGEQFIREEVKVALENYWQGTEGVQPVPRDPPWRTPPPPAL